MADRARHNEEASDAETPGLSAPGAVRRESMLIDLLDEVPRAARRRARRRASMRTAAALACLALVGVAWRQTEGRRPSAPAAPRAGASNPPLASLPPPGAVTIERVTTDEGVVARLAGSAGIAIERISDDDLLRTLSAIGRPAGLASLEGRVRLTANVADHLQISPGSAL